MYHGIAEGEATGVIPFWRVLVLPLLLLFLMSYFFEAPHETFHSVRVFPLLHQHVLIIIIGFHSVSISDVA